MCLSVHEIHLFLMVKKACSRAAIVVKFAMSEKNIVTCAKGSPGLLLSFEHLTWPACSQSYSSLQATKVRES